MHTQEWPSAMPELTAVRGMESPSVAGNGTKKIAGILSQPTILTFSASPRRINATNKTNTHKDQ